VGGEIIKLLSDASVDAPSSSRLAGRPRALDIAAAERRRWRHGYVVFCDDEIGGNRMAIPENWRVAGYELPTARSKSARETRTGARLGILQLLRLWRASSTPAGIGGDVQAGLERRPCSTRLGRIRGPQMALAEMEPAMERARRSAASCEPRASTEAIGESRTLLTDPSRLSVSIASLFLYGIEEDANAS